LPDQCALNEGLIEATAIFFMASMTGFGISWSRQSDYLRIPLPIRRRLTDAGPSSAKHAIVPVTQRDPEIETRRRRPQAGLAIALGAILAVGAARAGHAATDTMEDPAARAVLPEFQVIPAAKPGELTPAEAISMEPFGRWTRSQGDNGARRYSTLKQITRDNVASLEVAWTYHSKDGAADIESTPIIVDGVMYGPTPGRAIVAVDAATGAELWRFQVEKPARPDWRIRPRAVVSFIGPATGRMCLGSCSARATGFMR
jgi:glucose dehydrogenase